ncbi:hypothetical protein CHS0354_025666 [Potamilus streckersoni]|uniref:Uncharacterized protein n=1 Tax=Potamilus streckersoni TaxID=2493646 RepID=A0AAE0VL85_9BIVA|nr:hypothetical protein CHS0354_025666 [Potamilus streckersoni]
MSAYDQAVGGALKLKGVCNKIKKKKEKNKKRYLTKVLENVKTSTNCSGKDKPILKVDRRTKAEIAFEKAKENKAAEKIFEKASKTHKERIIEFNRQLDALTEHFDIPKK